MKFTLSWLKEHLETEATLQEICDQLTSVGLEVEGVEDRGKALSAFRVAHVIEAVQHPNADKLRVCKVDAGQGIIQVVCGAPNARTGMKAVFAPSGTYIPGSDITLKPTEIRGVASNGMLCSERELELSDAHEGIIELAADAPVGASYASVAGLEDPVIEVSITPNRSDCLGVGGIARDLAARKIGTLKSPKPATLAGSFKSPVSVSLNFAAVDQKACPLFVGRMIRGVKNGPSPKWLQQRLIAVGLRPISALVDITNYISFDRARPLHVYDVAKLTGNIQARLGKRGEKLLALDGKEYDIDAGMCVIADDSGPLGLGGVMGGEVSGCTESTVDVFVESALFDPIRTATTGRKLGINSDARFRFERGIDPLYALPGMEQATQMILDLCGGEASELMIAGQAPEISNIVSFRPERVESLGGVKMAKSDMVTILEALGFEVSDKGQACAVKAPSWRPDIVGEADIVEEVMRIHGFEHIPATPLDRPRDTISGALTARQRRVRLSRRVLAGRGLVEAVTWSFLRQSHAEIFGGGQPELQLANPISTDLGTMRPSLLPNLMAAAKRNADRGFGNVSLFEVGAQFENDTPQGQKLAACGLHRGETHARHWAEGLRPVDAYDAKADAFAVIEGAGLNPQSLQISADAPSWYHPGRSGTLRLGPKNIIGYFGELHPATLDALNVKGPMTGFEVFLDAIPYTKPKATRAKGPLNKSDFQAVERDFAFIVDEKVRAGDILRAAGGVDKKLIAELSVFDLYQGKGIEEGKKSVAITVRLQPRERTLTEAEIDDVAARIIASVTKATGGTLRA
jgi:phenylalanyl-tRNA synthetase beta chain